MNMTQDDRTGRDMTEKKRWRIKRAAMALLMGAMVAAGLMAPAPLRLHVIANSDSAADQQVKLMVRDAVLAATKDGVLQCENAGEAEEYIAEHLGIIVATANDTLKKNGFAYRATATVGVSHFPDREYQGVKYPEGDYEALRVVLGDGKGQNWWCVMFPPLCLSEIGADVDETQYTSLFAELYHNLFP
jgi:stage II sporulation protein R